MPWSILPKSVTAWLNRWDERFCEDVGDFHEAQEARARLYFQGAAGQLGHVEALVRDDVDLNFAIQREAALQRELKTLFVWLMISGAADVTTAEEIYSRIQTVETQLSALEEMIWRLERRTHEVLSRFAGSRLASLLRAWATAEIICSASCWPIASGCVGQGVTTM